MMVEEELFLGDKQTWWKTGDIESLGHQLPALPAFLVFQAS